MQTVYPLSENSGLALTTAKYYTPSGRLIQRDYYNVSIYDYYTRKEGAAPAQSEVKSTDGGRTVYGGGGITPDFEALEPKLNKFQENMARKYAFFNFSKRYLAENNGTIARTFEVTDAVLARFKKFLKEQDVAYEEADFATNLDYVQQQIKLELFLSIFGMDEAYKLEAAADTQILKGIQLLPQAAALEQNARQVIARRDPQ